jgi:hypothetical protein
MTVLDDVANLIIRISPDAVCDDCIKDKLGLTVRQHANRKTNILAKVSGFDRRKDVCSVCGGAKKVIRKS